MRKNLVQMLDELGLHKHLGLSSTIEFLISKKLGTYNLSNTIPCILQRKKL